jgi:predicted DNA-binding transcriptional regulator AlpA
MYVAAEDRQVSASVCPWRYARSDPPGSTPGPDGTFSPVALQNTKEPKMTQQSQHADSALAHDELLTISEVAAILRAPVATMRYWRHLGTGPRSFRLGRRVVYRAGDLQEWIDAQARASNSGTAAGE